jgi:hypothetical protein
MAALRDWRLSPFEAEGSTRHGLRAALCLNGHPWARADAEAAEIVAEALRLLGAKRPTWHQGQREYTTPRENCSYCGGDLDEESITRRDRFCSNVCARHAITRRDYAEGFRQDELGLRALLIINRNRNPERPCRQCGRAFRPRRFGQEHPFCSVECSNASNRYLDDRQCENCTTIFRPRGQSQRFCCHECSQSYREAVLPVRPCIACHGLFQPKLETALFCSPKCKQRTKDRRQVDRRRKRREATFPARSCDHCGLRYQPRTKVNRFCSERCQKADSRRRG